MAKTMSRPVALAIAVGLTLGGSLSVGTPAFAQPQLAEKAPAASQIEQDDDYSLQIHKKVNPQSYRKANGQQDPQASGAGVEGVEFEIQKLTGDVTKQGTFNELANLTNEFNRAAAGAQPDITERLEGTPRTQTTNAQGDITFNGLQPGAYLVTEKDGPQGLIKGKPFIAMVPMPTPNGEDWNDEVHVYPKNSQIKTEKRVVDQNKHARVDGQQGEGINRDSTVEYTLEGLVPAAPEGKVLKNFTLTDKYNKDELLFADNYIQSVEKVTSAGAATPLAEGQYRVVRNDNATGLPGDANATFSVIVDDPADAGLQAGDTLRVKVNATLLKAADQEIVNHADTQGFFRTPGQDVEEGDEPDFDTPDDETKTYIGKIKVVKHEQGNEDVKLAGASFNLFACSNPDEVIASGTTNDQGELLFEGIHVSDWVNDAPPANSVEYCLKETQAPDNYTIIEEEIRGIYLERGDQGPRDTTTIRQVSKNVANAPTTNVPILPSTGGMGILIVALLGLGIIAGGVYAARRNSAKA